LKSCFLILLTCLSFNAWSQNDTLLSIRDTIPVTASERIKVHRQRPLLLPVTFVVYGVLAQQMEVLKEADRDISQDLQEDYPAFSTHIDDKLQFIPAVSVYALGAIGIKGKNNFIDKSAMYFISSAVMGLSIDVLKSQTHRLRPDRSDYRSFPSGHTATAFVAAEFLNQEYKDVSPWYPLAGYTVAAATGTLRMINNKHWLSDVVMGAGVGILSTKLVYAVYPLVKRSIAGNRTSKVLLVPAYQQGSLGFIMRVPLN
jgi:hypothetical protein